MSSLQSRRLAASNIGPRSPLINQDPAWDHVDGESGPIRSAHQQDKAAPPLIAAAIESEAIGTWKHGQPMGKVGDALIVAGIGEVNEADCAR